MTIDVEQVQALVAAELDRPVSGVVRVPGSVANQDFVVALDDGGRVVLKTGPADEIAAESWVCRTLPAAGVPVPRVLTADSTGRAGLAYVILTFVDGQPSDDPAVARQAGVVLRRVHDVEPAGWGPLVVDDDGRASGRYDSRSEALRSELDALPALVAAGLLDPHVATTIRALLQVDDILVSDGPGVLLHNDLKPGHLFGLPDGASTRLTAIIDWGDARVGDPLADLARLSMSGPELTAAALDGYGLRADARLADRLARYRLLWNVGALAYEHRAGGDWFSVYRQRILGDLALLSR